MSADPGTGVRTVVVTGASAGLGYFAAEQLARAGHRVVLACRSRSRADAAEASIRQVLASERRPEPDVRHLLLDLADLDSVRSAADAFGELGPVDAVVNNAGVVGSSSPRTTAQGVELQIGTNHLGHFAWTALVLPHLEAAAADGHAPRIVHLGSIAHRWGVLPAADPFRATPYVDYLQYARSKRAVMLFGFALAERLAAAGSAVASVVAHPGLALGSLAPARPLVAAPNPAPTWVRPLAGVLSQGKDTGAEPLVDAAVGTGVRSGEYRGPAGWFQLRGAPAVVAAKPGAHDRLAAERLWRASEHRAGVRFALPD